jgi:DNA-binding NtrC family response regulator
MSRTPGILVSRNVAASEDRKTLPQIVAAYERLVIIQALQLNGFCRRDTAASLGISRGHLYSRIRLLKINLDIFPRPKRSSKPKKEPT